LSSSGLTEELCGENFLGHLKKNIVQRNVAEKKILASNWGMKKIRAQKNCPNPPPSKHAFTYKKSLELHILGMLRSITC
jgi:hypothetical protein